MQKTHSSGPARACDPTLDMAITGLMAALVFTGTYFFKIPTAFGYTHLGDCMIILTVCLFGTRRGMLAGAIGAGLSDFIAGYAAWVLPTIVLKGGWALIMGLIMYRLLPHFKYPGWPGPSPAAFPCIGYTLVKIPLYGGGVAHGRVLHPGGSDGCRDRPGRRGLHSPVQIPGHPEPAGEITLKSKKNYFFPVFL